MIAPQANLLNLHIIKKAPFSLFFTYRIYADHPPYENIHQ
jgi:hypothetical protein